MNGSCTHRSWSVPLVTGQARPPRAREPKGPGPHRYPLGGELGTLARLLPPPLEPTGAVPPPVVPPGLVVPPVAVVTGEVVEVESLLGLHI